MNKKKSGIVKIGKKYRKPQENQTEIEGVEIVKEYKYLGIIEDSSLTY